jgi:hypothetical protein
MRMMTAAALTAALIGVAGVSRATLSSGVQGAVVRGPTTPVCRAEMPCSAPVVGALVVARRAAATTVAARVRTDERGRFRLTLPPATYMVSVSLTRGTTVRTQQKRVHVQDGRFAALRFVFDTGIR